MHQLPEPSAAEYEVGSLVVPSSVSTKFSKGPRECALDAEADPLRGYTSVHEAAGAVPGGQHIHECNGTEDRRSFKATHTITAQSRHIIMITAGRYPCWQSKIGGRSGGIRDSD